MVVKMFLEIMSGLIIVLLILIIVLIIVLLRKGSNSFLDEVKNRLNEFEKYLIKYESLVKDEFVRNRDDFNKNSKDSREELNTIFKNFTNILEQRLKNIQDVVTNSAKENRIELSNSLKSFEEKFSINVKDFNELQKQKFDNLINKQDDLTLKTEAKLEKLREVIEQKLKSIQEDNNIKLEKMRETVDEKLHKTLETRLGESFKIVSERLELVQKGLGEMQTLATGVGDLKKVLSNVKTKGVLGEYQLENILEQLMTPEQYSKNVKTKKQSNDMVEFAIKLPSKDDSNKILWLPIDAKFPSEDYELLMNAYDTGDTVSIEKGKKALEQKIKSFAKDIKGKYIDPPNTTDFAIMFLPFEGLYAEILRIPGIFETIQKDYKITIAGPTTISAFLSSLQMGFRSLAVEKRTSEIWDILGAVRTEFGKFGEVLEKTKTKLEQASKEIENAGVRSRAIEKKLKNVQELPKEDSMKLLGESISTDDDSNE
jgi:DNA recombination protein RmuC